MRFPHPPVFPLLVRCLLASALVTSCTSENAGKTDKTDDSAQNCANTETTDAQQSTSGFESAINDSRWQLLWRGGAGIEHWSDPDFVGWNQPLVSACSCNAASPDRIVLTISGDIGDVSNEAQTWADEIDRAITTSLMKYPSLQQVILQAVVGGPNAGTCFDDNGKEVRASVNSPVINQAIDLVVNNHAADITVLKGIAPEVTECADYVDTRGHLTAESSPVIGLSIGEYYATNHPGDFSCTQVTGFSQSAQWYTGRVDPANF